jgi:penicillin-binding protein-related factor A (putative recombinase)
MSEAAIRDSIFEYLMHRQIFAWRDRQVPRGLRFGVKPEQKGVPDILGIFKGKPLAIEVKDGRGQLSIEQGEFINNFRAQGGIAFVARSVEEVIAKLREVEGALR